MSSEQDSSRPIKITLRVNPPPSVPEVSPQPDEKSISTSDSSASSPSSSDSEYLPNKRQRKSVSTPESSESPDRRHQRVQSGLRHKMLNAAQQEAEIQSVRDSLTLFKEPAYGRFVKGLQGAQDALRRGASTAKRVAVQSVGGSSGEKNIGDHEQSELPGRSGIDLQRSILKPQGTFEDRLQNALRTAQNTVTRKSVLFISNAGGYRTPRDEVGEGEEELMSDSSSEISEEE